MASLDLALSVVVPAVVGAGAALLVAWFQVRERGSSAQRTASVRLTTAAHQAAHDASVRLVDKRVEAAEVAFSQITAAWAAVSDIVLFDQMFNQEAVRRVFSADFGTAEGDRVLGSFFVGSPLRNRHKDLLSMGSFRTPSASLLFLPPSLRLPYLAHLEICARLASNWSELRSRLPDPVYDWRQDPVIRELSVAGGLSPSQYEEAAGASAGGLQILLLGLQEHYRYLVHRAVLETPQTEDDLTARSRALARAASQVAADSSGDQTSGH